ncbi:MAG TPA: hypothetical protein VMV78_01220, partial [Thiobacillus sp.]|nr:hypothetical protein [Thiobacillus sp.]
LGHLFQSFFIGETALASLLAPSRTICTVSVARSSPPCLTFEIELERMSWKMREFNPIRRSV